MAFFLHHGQPFRSAHDFLLNANLLAEEGRPILKAKKVKIKE